MRRAGRFIACSCALAIAMAATIVASSSNGRAADVSVSATSPAAGRAPIAATYHNGFEAVTTANRYLAWRIRVVQTGDFFIDFSGVTDGIFTTSLVGIPGGEWTGGGGASNPTNVQIRVAGRSFSEAQGGGGGSGGGPNPPGDYIVVGLIAGGGAHAGIIHAQVTAPVGSTIEGFSSGPARQLTDVDFANNLGPAYVPLPGASFTGSVAVPVRSVLFGIFMQMASNPNAGLSYTDPHEITIEPPCCSFGWFDSEPGTYILHLNEVAYDPKTPVVAMLADVQLP